MAMDEKALYKITYGLYVVSAQAEGQRSPSLKGMDTVFLSSICAVEKKVLRVSLVTTSGSGFFIMLVSPSFEVWQPVSSSPAAQARAAAAVHLRISLTNLSPFVKRRQR